MGSASVAAVGERALEPRIRSATRLEPSLWCGATRWRWWDLPFWRVTHCGSIGRYCGGCIERLFVCLRLKLLHDGDNISHLLLVRRYTVDVSVRGVIEVVCQLLELCALICVCVSDHVVEHSGEEHEPNQAQTDPLLHGLNSPC